MLRDIVSPSSRLSRPRTRGGATRKRAARRPAPAQRGEEEAPAPEALTSAVPQTPEQKIANLVVTAFGLGNLPLAPGTWASAAAAAAYLVLHSSVSFAFEKVFLAAAVALCMYAGLTLWSWARGNYRRDDPPQFVLDEVAGMWLVCLFLWPGAGPGTVLIAFILFRVLDVIKPNPICKLERLPSGWGVMLDDVAAAACAAALLWAYHGIIIPRLAS